MYVCQAVREFQGDATQSCILLAIHCHLFLPSNGTIHIDQLSLCLQAGTRTTTVVHHLNLIGSRIPLDVQRFRSLLTTKVGSCRLEVIVIGLPYHRRPSRMGHPQQEALAVQTAGFKHGTIAIIVHPLCPIGKFLGIGRFAKALFNDLIERSTRLCTLHRIVMLSPLCILRPQGIR